jgi:hypothetical protein
MASPLPKSLLFRLAIILCVVCLLPARAAAWGNAGHRIIARVAWEYLTPRAKEAVTRLLGKEDLASASTYADDVRSLRPETTAWHFVEMPRNAQSYVPTRDCVETARGDCAVAVVERLGKVLTSNDVKTTDEERAEALKFLVHLIGDLHQPLHCGYKDDAGGNKIRVVFFGNVTNLHAVWDTYMIEYAKQAAGGKLGLSDDEYATQRLLTLLNPAIATFMAKGTPEEATQWLAQLDPDERMQKATPGDWAFESYQLAVRAVNSACKSNPKLMQLPSDIRGCAEQSALKPLPLEIQYYNDYSKIMDKQLLWAGVRLALVLNDIFR